MKYLFILFFILTISACKKKHELIYGQVNVSGKITDIVSNLPIQHSVVQLIKVELQPNGLGGTSAVRTEVATTDTTDAFGNYELSFTANGEYELEVLALPSDEQHVLSDYTKPQDHSIQTAGTFIKDLKCYRSAFAKVIVKNVAPIDTPYFINLSAQNSITLNNFYKDTLVYLKLVGNLEFSNAIRFNKNNDQIQDLTRNIGAWDTIPMELGY